MKSNAYIIAIPKSLIIDTLLVNKPELRTYMEDVVEDQSYSQLEDILEELKLNIEVDMVGSTTRMAIMYYIIDYAKECHQLLGQIVIPGNIEKIINVEAKNVKESTRHHILRYGLLDGIMRRVLDGV